MKKLSITIRHALVVCTAGFLFTGTISQADAQVQLTRDAVQTRINPADLKPTLSSNPSIVEQIIHQGSQLETSAKWGEALTHYEQAIKDYPQDANLQRRLLSARVHFDLKRRYLDSSYVKSVRRSDQRTASETFAELLLKIQSHHVDNPDWLAFARRGMSNLDIALFDPVFQKAHLSGV